MNFLDSLFNPSSIALIGAAHTENKLGGIVLKNLLKFMGAIYPVNPKYGKIMGLKTYRSVLELPMPVDLSIIIRPAEEVPSILLDLQGKTKIAIIASSGFAEIGKMELQNEIRNICIETGIRILGPNCMGVINSYAGIDTFFVPHKRLRRPAKGNIAVVSQSGALIHCLLEAVKSWNAGISIAVGYGNALDINESDIYEYFESDNRTSLVISYVESVSDGRRFIETAKKLSDKKPFIILKSGKSDFGLFAALSHTGRLAGRYEVFRSILRQFDILEANNLDDLMDAAKALSFCKPVRGNKVCIITNGGGSGVLAVDECIRQGLDVDNLPEKKAARLRKIFPSFYTIKNPLDITAQGKDEDYIAALDELHEDYDGFLIFALAGVTGITERIGILLEDFKKRVGKPLVFHTTRNTISKKIDRYLEHTGIPSFASPERAVKGLRALLR